MPSLHLRGSRRVSGRGSDVSFAVLLALSVASALTGAIVALVVQRLVQRHQYIEVLPQPDPTLPLAAPAAVDTAQGASVAPDLAARRSEESPLGAVSSNLTAARLAELERLLAEDDVIAGDGTDTCPVAFPIKANGRSGIYHWPGAIAYAHTRPTLCFKSREAAERAGFRPAKR